MEVGNMDVFLESCTIASACNKEFRKWFLKPETIGLIPSGGYSCNRNYSKKALIWILHMEEEDRCKILHTRNGREVRLPELPQFSVDGYCAETRTVYEFIGCFFHGCVKCQPFLDLKTLGDDTLAELYERTMSRLEQITNAGYTVKVMWECEFQESRIVGKTAITNTPNCYPQSSIQTRCPVRVSNGGNVSSV